MIDERNIAEGHRRERWCPSCLDDLQALCVRVTDEGQLECAACGLTLDLDEELVPYARHGRLVTTWGRTSCLVEEHGRKVDPDLGEVLRGTADDVLDAAMRDNSNRIAALWATLLRARALFEAEASKVVQAWIRGLTLGLIESMRARGCNPEEVVDAVRVRGGDPSLLERVHLDGGPIRPHLPRSTPFASLRHALTAACGVDAEVLLGRRSSRYAAPETMGRLPGGVVFDQIAVKPTRAASHRAQSEGVLVALTDVRAAIAAARINGRPLSAVELDLLMLVEVGLTREAATRTRTGVVVPAVEPLKLAAAIRHLQTCDPDPETGEPRLPTEHEARRMLARARMAVLEQLLERQLVPPPLPRKRRADADKPAPVAIEPIGTFQPPGLG